MDHNIVDVVFDFLNLIINLYERDNIEFDAFYECSKTKISFLEYALSKLLNEKEKEEATLLLIKCKNYVNATCSVENCNNRL